jgi:hypothetical protein
VATTRLNRLAAFLLGVGISLAAYANTYKFFTPATGILVGSSTSYVTTAAASTDVIALWGSTPSPCSSSTFLRGDGNCAAAGGGTGANPTASVGLTAVNGVATTFLRSDGAPALSQSISPTWTGSHLFNGIPVLSTTNAGVSIGRSGSNAQVVYIASGGGTDSKIWQVITSNVDLQYQIDSDNLATVKNYLDITRSGAVITNIALGNATDNPSYTFLGSGTVTFNGGAASNVSGKSIVPLVGTSASIGGSALAAGACSAGTATVTGAAAGMASIATPNADPDSTLTTGIAIYSFISASNTVTIRVCAIVAVTPTATTYNVRVIP